MSKLEAAREQFSAQYGRSHNTLLNSIPQSLTKRTISAADRLSAARDQLEAGLSPLHKRIAMPESPREALAAAKAQLDDAYNHPSFTKRTAMPESPREALAAAKAKLADAYNHPSLTRRDDDSAPTGGVADMPTSTMQKTVIPLVIGIV
jgi:hypothetical protein